MRAAVLEDGGVHVVIELVGASNFGVDLKQRAHRSWVPVVPPTQVLHILSNPKLPNDSP
jgi:hypothetical protein